MPTNGHEDISRSENVSNLLTRETIDREAQNPTHGRRIPNDELSAMRVAILTQGL
jgi:hypothetical protein